MKYLYMTPQQANSEMIKNLDKQLASSENFLFHNQKFTETGDQYHLRLMKSCNARIDMLQRDYKMLLLVEAGNVEELRRIYSEASNRKGTPAPVNNAPGFAQEMQEGKYGSLD